MAEQTFEKKVTWGEKHNFVAEDEITVTITLAEYRELVKEVARKDKDIDQARQIRYEAEKKAEAANAKLNAFLDKLASEEEEDEEDA